MNNEDAPNAALPEDETPAMPLSADMILNLQSLIGNQAVLQMLGEKPSLPMPPRTAAAIFPFLRRMPQKRDAEDEK